MNHTHHWSDPLKWFAKSELHSSLEWIHSFGALLHWSDWLMGWNAPIWVISPQMFCSVSNIFSLIYLYASISSDSIIKEAYLVSLFHRNYPCHPWDWRFWRSIALYVGWEVLGPLDTAADWGVSAALIAEETWVVRACAVSGVVESDCCFLVEGVCSSSLKHGVIQCFIQICMHTICMQFWPNAILHGSIITSVLFV